jgi:hypothetical protein
MEEINFISFETQYLAVYDPDTYQVIKVGPSSAFIDEKNKILIDESLALDIIEGNIRLTNCYIDIDSKALELTEKKYINKIDDVLHRITEKKWIKNKFSEIYLTYHRKNNSLKIQMTSMYSGTKKVNSNLKRKILWSGDTLMDFYITGYNDPHDLYKILSFTINDLIGQTKEFKDLELPKKFSVYTRRIFKGYVLEIR